MTEQPAFRSLQLPVHIEQFRKCQQLVCNVQQLMRLCADIQQHRGCTLAILAGDDTFNDRVAVLQQKIAARLTGLGADTALCELAGDSQWEAVLSEWQVVGYGWHQDQFLQNFELHSHLIDQLLRIVQRAGENLFASDCYLPVVAAQYLGHEVFEFLFYTLPGQIENLARLRGLSTHAAAQGCCSADLRMRLEYLLYLVKKDAADFEQLLMARPISVLRRLPAMFDVQMTETVFERWLELIHANILVYSETRPELAAMVFDMATAVVNSRLAVSEQGFTCLHAAFDAMYEQALSQAAVNFSGG